MSPATRIVHSLPTASLLLRNTFHVNWTGLDYGRFVPDQRHKGKPQLWMCLASEHACRLRPLSRANQLSKTGIVP